MRTSNVFSLAEGPLRVGAGASAVSSLAVSFAGVSSAGVSAAGCSSAGCSAVSVVSAGVSSAGVPSAGVSSTAGLSSFFTLGALAFTSFLKRTEEAFTSLVTSSPFLLKPVNLMVESVSKLILHCVNFSALERVISYS
ncbi:MAG: hypothetical protein E7030_04095 [Akkermansiaceae bacterium]|nr:hypothetical protein [Akkermansiaceae bacterium]